MTRYRFRGSSREIRQTLETFGYYNADIEAGLDTSGECPIGRFDITPGPRTTYSDVNIRITGDESLFRLALRSDAPTAGSPLDHSAYESFKSRLEDVAARYGFLEASFVQTEIVVDASENTARLMLNLDTGPRYRFGDIIYPNLLLQQRALERYHPFDSGTPYDAEKLEALYFGLRESGYFEDVVVRPLAPVGQSIPVQVQLFEGQRRTRRVGIGASTDLGPNVSFSQVNRLVNDRGHQTNFNMSLSPAESKAGASYRIPSATAKDGWFSIYGGVDRIDTTSSVSTASTVGVRRIRPRQWGWIETVYLEVVNDRFDIIDLSDTTTHLVPGIRYTQTSADSATTRASRAHRVDIELFGAAESLGSSTDVTSVRVEGKIIRKLVGDLRILARGRAGLTATNDFDRLPPRTRFYSGGDTRARGYDLEAIGVIEADGSIVGGDRLLEYSVEVDHGIGQNWAIAAFSDAAAVSRNTFSNDFTRSVGIGMRWYSPVGPIRIDIAKPLDGDESFRLHLSLGPEI